MQAAQSNLSNKNDDRLIHPRPRNRFFRVVLITILILILIVAIGGYFFLNYQNSSMSRQVEKQLNTVMLLKIEELKSWRLERISDARSLMLNEAVTESAAKWIQESNDIAYNYLQNELKEFTTLNKYQNASLVDKQGNVKLSVQGQTTLAVETLARLGTALESREVQFVDFFSINPGSRKWI